MADIWKYVTAITQSKDRSIFDDIEFDGVYQPFIVNRALSYHEDAVLSANLMNERPLLDKSLQARFLLHTLRARRRFAKWHKNEISDDVLAIAEYYACSVRRAREMVMLHTPEQLEIIRRCLDKGGIAAKRMRHGAP